MGERVTLEPINNDIVGAQANYSCSDGCDLHGSSSLRCRSMGSPVNDYEWVDESTSISPSCICSGQCHFVLRWESCFLMMMHDDTTAVLFCPQYVHNYVDWQART